MTLVLIDIPKGRRSYSQQKTGSLSYIKMNSLIVIKHRVMIPILLFSLLNLSACFMMSFPVIPMMNDAFKPSVDQPLNDAITELMEESINDLIHNSDDYEQLLLGEVKVSGSFISVERFRMLLSETLRKRIGQKILVIDELMAHPSKNSESVKSSPEIVNIVLNAQIYKGHGRIWFAQQLVDIRSNRRLWSGIYSRPIPIAGRKAVSWKAGKA